jgi:hypothetical protein
VEELKVTFDVRGELVIRTTDGLNTAVNPAGVVAERLIAPLNPFTLVSVTVAF